MKILTFNILTDGIGPGDMQRHEDIRRVIETHDPDILCMQEGGDSVYWKTIAEEYGYNFSVNNEGLYRPSLYIRGAVTDHRIYDEFHPGAISARITLSGKVLTIINLHLPHKVVWDPERVDALQHIFEQEQLDINDDILICGDFNSRCIGEPGHPRQLAFVQTLSELDRPLNDTDWTAATTLMKERGFIDCYRHLHPDPGYSVGPPVEAFCDRVPDLAATLTTEQAQRRFMPKGVRIDYIFASPSMLKRLQSCDIINDPETLDSSDHAPFVAVFSD